MTTTTTTTTMASRGVDSASRTQASWISNRHHKARTSDKANVVRAASLQFSDVICVRRASSSHSEMLAVPDVAWCDYGWMMKLSLMSGT
jgi:hypothetical protein